MVPDKDRETVAAMAKYGGSFVKQLAVCINLADNFNYERLKNAFPEYFEKYQKMAEDLKSKKD